MSLPASDVVLDVAGLRVDLAGRPVDVVRGIDLQVARGEIVGLVGESGSGKTTLALALLGHARPGTRIVAGSVAVEGVDLLSLAPAELRRARGERIAYVPQDPAAALNPSLRIGSQLLEVLDAHGSGEQALQRVHAVLDDVRLPSDRAFLRRYPHQLSGGQRQRIALAMAFACRPAVVVLDEPTTGLDVTTQAHVLATVRALCEEHRTAAVYVSHDLAVVGALAARIAVLYSGRLIELGPREALLHDAAHPYTRALIRSVPDARRRRMPPGIRGRVTPPAQRPDGCAFAARCDFADAGCTTGTIEREQLDARREVRCRRSALVRSHAPPVEAGLAPAAAPATAPDAELVVRGLVAHYGAHEALHGVDVHVRAGSCTALVGASGSGKSTLGRCVGGLHAEATGDLRLNGEPLALGSRGRSPQQRRAVQYVFQDPYGSLNPRKTIRASVEQPLRLAGMRDRAELDRRVGELLEQVALHETLADRHPAQLSGGERQRVAIARALAARPRILICDEVTASLDVSVQASILELLVRLRGETGLTLLFITHDLALVRTIADEVVVLEDGRVVEEGPVGRVLDAPEHAYTRQLMRDAPALA